MGHRHTHNHKRARTHTHTQTARHSHSSGSRALIGTRLVARWLLLIPPHAATNTFIPQEAATNTVSGSANQTPLKRLLLILPEPAIKKKKLKTSRGCD